MRLNIIITSTRPGRVGPAVGRWFHAFAQSEGSFDARLVDLADFALPVYDEPHHPRLGKYQHAPTRRWSESVAAADALALVPPAYNFGPTPALLTALNYGYTARTYKPTALVHTRGVSVGHPARQ